MTYLVVLYVKLRISKQKWISDTPRFSHKLNYSKGKVYCKAIIEYYTLADSMPKHHTNFSSILVLFNDDLGWRKGNNITNFLISCFWACGSLSDLTSAFLEMGSSYHFYIIFLLVRNPDLILLWFIISLACGTGLQFMLTCAWQYFNFLKQWLLKVSE